MCRYAEAEKDAEKKGQKKGNKGMMMDNDDDNRGAGDAPTKWNDYQVGGLYNLRIHSTQACNRLVCTPDL